MNLKSLFKIILTVLCLGIVGLFLQQLSFSHFASSIWLWLLLLIPALGGLFGYSQKKVQQLRQQYMALELMRKVMPQQRRPTPWLGGVLMLLIACSLILALARPQGEPIAQESEGSGIDILIAIDVSESMKAQDMYPSRLNVAKEIIRNFIYELNFDRVGLIAFTNEAISLAPLTNDYSALDTLVGDLNTDLLPSGGTRFSELFRVVRDRFQASKDTGKLLILLSDGENHEEDLEISVKPLREDDVYIYTVGIGTESGAKVPEKEDFWGNKVYKTYQGQEVVSHLQPDVLKKIANIGRGKYLHANNRWKLTSAVKDIRKDMRKKRYKVTGQVVYEEKFQWYLLLALLFLIMERFQVIFALQVSGMIEKISAPLLKLKQRHIRSVIKDIKKKPAKMKG